MKRFEKKFIVTKSTFDKTKKELRLKEIYPARIVKSIYYDTYDFKYFKQSEEGITPRIKIRRRGYNLDNLSNYEIKKTNNYFREKIVSKNQDHNNIIFQNFLNQNKISDLLEEKILVTYKRFYFTCLKYNRLTFDQNIQIFSLRNNYKIPLRIDEQVLEIKIETNQLDPIFIEKNISLKESRFSKYCLGIRKYLNLN